MADQMPEACSKMNLAHPGKCQIPRFCNETTRRVKSTSSSLRINSKFLTAGKSDRVHSSNECPNGAPLLCVSQDIIPVLADTESLLTHSV